MPWSLGTACLDPCSERGWPRVAGSSSPPPAPLFLLQGSLHSYARCSHPPRQLRFCKPSRGHEKGVGFARPGKPFFPHHLCWVTQPSTTPPPHTHTHTHTLPHRCDVRQCHPKYSHAPHFIHIARPSHPQSHSYIHPAPPRPI